MVARNGLHTNVQISLLARDGKAWWKGKILFICIFYIGQEQPETFSKEKGI